ncbi:hypothetical protein CAP35_09355 [Chitinophagaceae bacterium IBVUCB1]|nr:hypothetical protein CAP35_09355 [Chitinophagaceae bacterium IBVUCB1]
MRYHIVMYLLLCSIASFAKGADTIKLYYPINVSAMSPASVHSIDSLIYMDVLRPGKKIGILGYADYLGSAETNITLSEARANTVKEYLLRMGLKEDDIQIVIGRGEVSRTDTNSKEGYATDRRVDIIPGGFKALPKPPVKPVAVKPDTVKPLINLQQVKKNQTIRLNRIFFYPGMHKVKEESIPVVDSLYMIMRDNPKLRIRIEGHICCVVAQNADGYDFDTQDFKLSANRAKEIYDMLADKGIDEERMEYMGFGKSKPLAWPERTEEDENMNRRVEIRVLDK